MRRPPQGMPDCRREGPIMRDRDEPTLRDLLDDPIVLLVMESDSVRREEVRALFERLRPMRQAERERVEAA